MKRVILVTYALLFLLILSFGQQDVRHGQQLFRTNCSPCHGIGKERIGPSLASVTKKRTREWLHRFITNSQSVILSGDAYANHLFEQYNHSIMPPFRKFSVNDIDAILSYIEKTSYTKDDPYYESFEVNKETGWNITIPVAGELLFQQHCSQCHSVYMEGYGPALASVTKRRPADWLYRFVHHSAGVIDSGDPYAGFLYQQFDRKRMPGFQYLDSATVRSIFEYIEFASAAPSFISGVNGREAQTHTQLPVLAGRHPEKSESGLPENREASKLFFKIFLGLIFALSGLVHIVLIMKFYRYLSVD